MSTTAIRAIKTAWQAYQKTEKYGFKFGKVCSEWQEKFKAQGKKGEGLLPMLEEVGIPTSTAYYWINRYKESMTVPTGQTETAAETGQTDEKPPKVHTLESHSTARRTILRSQVKAYFTPMKSKPDFKNILGGFVNEIWQDFGFEPVEPEVTSLVVVKAGVEAEVAS